jgi:Serine hydrolase (FSH1)
MSTSSLTPSAETGAAKAKGTTTTTRMKRILCLHGKFQSGAIMSNKIAGARRKLARVYQLDFLNGPILLLNDEKSCGSRSDEEPPSSSSAAAGPVFAWFLRGDE